MENLQWLIFALKPSYLVNVYCLWAIEYECLVHDNEYTCDIEALANFMAITIYIC